MNNPPTLNIKYRPSKEVMRGRLSKDINYQLILSCELDCEVISKLIILLEAQKKVLESN